MNAPFHQLDHEFAARRDELARRDAAFYHSRVLTADSYRDPTFIARYDGIGIFRLSCGLYYSMETGCAETIEAVRQDITAWRERMEQDILDGDMEPVAGGDIE